MTDLETPARLEFRIGQHTVVLMHVVETIYRAELDGRRVPIDVETSLVEQADLALMLLLISHGIEPVLNSTWAKYAEETGTMQLGFTNHQIGVFVAADLNSVGLRSHTYFIEGCGPY